MSKLFLALGGGAFLFLLLQPVLAGTVLMINRNEVRIRADATIQSERIASLRQGDEIEQLGRKDEWFQVRLPDGREGWVNALLVQERLVVTGSGVRIRADGLSTSASLAVTVEGEELGKTGREKGNWYEVVLPDGKQGWISKNYVRPKEISITPDDGTIPPAEQNIRAEMVAQAASAAEEQLEPEPGSLQSNPYAEGLGYEAEENYPAALRSFEQVLEEEPDKLNARLHAALAHKQLQDYDAALEDLYYALERSGGRRDIYMHLGEVYRLKGKADSTRKYRALYRGEEFLPAAEIGDEGRQNEAESDSLFADTVWIYVAGVVGAMAVVGVLIGLLRRQNIRTRSGRKRATEKEEGGKFGRELQGSRTRRGAGEISGAEEDELDRQIEDKWQELRQSAEIFAVEDLPGDTPENKGEDAHLDQVLSHLETLRKGLEMQDERARIYTDIVRLQSMKIEAMDEELRLLGRRRK